MSDKRRTTYVSVSITPEVKDDYQREMLTLSAAVGRRLTMNEVVGATLAVARQHPKELHAALAAPEQEGTTR